MSLQMVARIFCRPVGMSAADSNETQNAANNVLDVVTVLVIFFEARLVHALQHSLQGVVKPATGPRRL